MSSEKYIVIPGGLGEVSGLYKRADDKPTYTKIAWGKSQGILVELAETLNHVEEIESSITELAEEAPVAVAKHPAEVKLEQIAMTLNDHEKGYVGPGKTLRIIKSILEGKVIQ